MRRKPRKGATMSSKCSKGLRRSQNVWPFPAHSARLFEIILLLLLLFFRLKSTCSLRLWCFTHHATSSLGTSIMVGFVYLLLAYLYATNLLIFFFFFICPFRVFFA